MIKPEEFQIKGQEEKIYRLIKLLYKFKQFSRHWHLKYHQAILEMG